MLRDRMVGSTVGVAIILLGKGYMFDYSLSQFPFDKDGGYYRIRTRILTFVAELNTSGQLSINSHLILSSNAELYMKHDSDQTATPTIKVEISTSQMEMRQ